ncbi:hypothetical protein W619_02672, partial [Staphylococcus aureus VET0383R]
FPVLRSLISNLIIVLAPFIQIKKTQIYCALNSYPFVTVTEICPDLSLPSVDVAVITEVPSATP